MGILCAWHAERLGAFAVGVPGVVLVEADSLAGEERLERVIHSLADDFCDLAPVRVAGESPAFGAGLVCRFPCVESAVFPAFLVVVFVAVASSCVEGEVFGHPGLFANFYGLVLFSVSVVCKGAGFFAFGGGGYGDACCQGY